MWAACYSLAKLTLGFGREVSLLLQTRPLALMANTVVTNSHVEQIEELNKSVATRALKLLISLASFVSSFHVLYF